MSLFTDPRRIPENYGLKIAAGLIAFFLLMKVVGLAHIYELRFLNVIIQIGGIYYALKKFKETHLKKISTLMQKHHYLRFDHEIEFLS